MTEVSDAKIDTNMLIQLADTTAKQLKALWAATGCSEEEQARGIASLSQSVKQEFTAFIATQTEHMQQLQNEITETRKDMKLWRRQLEKPEEVIFTYY